MKNRVAERITWAEEHIERVIADERIGRNIRIDR